MNCESSESICNLYGVGYFPSVDFWVVFASYLANTHRIALIVWLSKVVCLDLMKQCFTSLQCFTFLL